MDQILAATLTSFFQYKHRTRDWNLAP